MPKTIAYITLGIIVAVSTGALVYQRIASAPQRQPIELIAAWQANPDTAECVQPDKTREQIYTCPGRYNTYRVDGATITLAENSTLTTNGALFRFDTGRIVVDGNITLTARDVRVTTDGVVTLVHYSWMDKIDLNVLSGSATVRQGSFTSTVTANNAVAIDTLPPYTAIAPTLFNLDAASVAAFYEWAL